jgi:hypothetical protein
MDPWWRICRTKGSARSNHAKHAEKAEGSIGWSVEAPSAITADVAVVNIPVASGILEGARYEHAFKVPDIVYYHNLFGESLTIKNLFHSDLRLTSSSKTGITHCEVIQQCSKRGSLGPPI